jgi:hypothetical protein
MLGNLGRVSALGSQEKVQWPVRNPLLQQKDFQPDYKSRIISGVYGPRLKWGASPRYDHHEGWDFYAFYDAKFPNGHHPVHAILPGKVFQIINPADPSRIETGRKVVLQHKLSWSKFGGPKSWGPVFTGYNHLHDFKVTPGQSVAAGDAIGSAGKTGYTRTVHLHFNCYRHDGKRLVNVNPARLFAKQKRGWMQKMSSKNSLAKVLSFDKDANRAILRIMVQYNCLSFDGFSLSFGSSSKERRVSFEGVSALLRDKRDQGDKDLFGSIRLYPLRFNGGETLDRLNVARRLPAAWPAKRLPATVKQTLQAWDVVVEDIPESSKAITVTLRGVLGEKIKLKCALKR